MIGSESDSTGQDHADLILGPKSMAQASKAFRAASCICLEVAKLPVS